MCVYVCERVCVCLRACLWVRQFVWEWVRVFNSLHAVMLRDSSVAILNG